MCDRIVPPCRAAAAASSSASTVAAPSTRRLLAEMQQEMTRGGGAITFPVYHRTLEDGNYKKSPSRSTLDTSNDDTSSTGPSPSPVNDLKSTLVTLDQSFGQYFAIFDIGTPSIDIAVIVDTGSEILWINCQPCTHCGAQAKGYKVFDPKQSTSFEYLKCFDDSACRWSESIVEASCDSSGRCAYNVTYGDHSNSSGYLSRDILTVESAVKGAPPYQRKDFLFGCGNNNTGIESQKNASGLMGLGRGSFSIVSQLHVNIFVYCLPNRIQTTDVTGYLTLGKSSVTANIPLRYTPMIQNSTASTSRSPFYYMNMTGISINGNLLHNIPPSAFEITSDGEAGGTIIDSGTTLTTFVEEAYTIFEKAFTSALDPSLTRADCGISQLLCYQAPVYQGAPQAPNVTIHFANSFNLNLSTDHSFLFFKNSATYSCSCMAFNKAGSIETGGRNFIGNYQQQNFLVEYDIENSQIGFAPHICNQKKHK